MNYQSIKYRSADRAAFNEDRWLQTLFMINDTQTWLNEVQQGLINHLPLNRKKKLLQKGFYLSAPALAHILERHYNKIPLHPFTSKFTIPVIEILACIRDAHQRPPTALQVDGYVQRVANCGKVIGLDIEGKETKMIKVISNNEGNIITAFPTPPVPLKGELRSIMLTKTDMP